MLKNARTEYHNEFEEIGFYASIESLAETVGDKDTAKLARGIKREEERMAKFLEKQIEQLAKAVAREEIPAAERNGGSSGGARRRRRSSSSSRAVELVAREVELDAREVEFVAGEVRFDSCKSVRRARRSSSLAREVRLDAREVELVAREVRLDARGAESRSRRQPVQDRVEVALSRLEPARRFVRRAGFSSPAWTPRPETQGAIATRPRRSGSIATSVSCSRSSGSRCPGVQVLFAFLLVVPFNQRFPDITELPADDLLHHPAARHRGLGLPDRAHRAPPDRVPRRGQAAHRLLGHQARDRRARAARRAMTGAVMLITDMLYHSDHRRDRGQRGRAAVRAASGSRWPIKRLLDSGPAPSPRRASAPARSRAPCRTRPRASRAAGRARAAARSARSAAAAPRSGLPGAR